MAGESRVARLIGDGNVTGGGLPLPVAFTAVTEFLLDNGEASFMSLSDVVRTALAFKEKRVLSTAWRSWDDFTRDILAQLSDTRVITECDGADGYMAYRVRKDFVPGRRHVVIPSAGIGFVAREKDDRDMMNTNTALLAALRTGLVPLTDARDRHLDGDPVALALLETAVGCVTDAVDVLKKATSTGFGDPHRKRSHKPRQLKGVEKPAVKPSAEELAERKYGFAGAPPSKRVKASSHFGGDGLRACTMCHVRQLPSAFRVTWDGRVGDWFLPAWCMKCDNARQRKRYTK